GSADKDEILQRLNSLVGKPIKVRILDATTISSALQLRDVFLLFLTVSYTNRNLSSHQTSVYFFPSQPLKVLYTQDK
ncbi:MAG: hypothetical protein IJN59_03040, partial [Oscillospiraceae bacterium]|nr:hypothetical protein [Oscillospiraceae bacterium]